MGKLSGLMALAAQTHTNLWANNQKGRRRVTTKHATQMGNALWWQVNFFFGAKFSFAGFSHTSIHPFPHFWLCENGWGEIAHHQIDWEKINAPICVDGFGTIWTIWIWMMAICRLQFVVNEKKMAPCRFCHFNRDNDNKDKAGEKANKFVCCVAQMDGVTRANKHTHTHIPSSILGTTFEFHISSSLLPVHFHSAKIYGA